MKRKLETALSVIFIIVIFIGIEYRPEYVGAAERYDYSGFWALGNAKISVDSRIYCCAFSGTTGYGGIVYPDSSSFTVSCGYRIFASCAAGGRFYYLTDVGNGGTECNVIIYDAYSGLTDTFVIENVKINSNDQVAADIYGNLYFVGSENTSVVKCFATSGRLCCEISIGGSVSRLVTSAGGNVLAVSGNGNYLINSSGGCSYAEGGGDIYQSGNGYFSDTAGGVYNSSASRVYSGAGISVCSSQGYVACDGSSLVRFNSSGKACEETQCLSGVSRMFAIENVVITFNGSGLFEFYRDEDFSQIYEETTAPTTQILTEEITRPTEEESVAATEATEKPTQGEEITNEESFVVSSVYTLDDTLKYILGVLPSTNEKEFIGNFSLQNTEYILQRGNDTNSYIANGDMVSFISNGNTETYRIVVNRDFNCDGKFNGDDIDAMAYLLLSGGSIHEWQSMCVDINDNGNVDLSDLYDCYLNS